MIASQNMLSFHTDGNWMRFLSRIWRMAKQSSKKAMRKSRAAASRQQKMDGSMLGSTPAASTRAAAQSFLRP